MLAMLASVQGCSPPSPLPHGAPRMRLSFRRIKRLAPADIALAAEAACMLTFFRAALNFSAHAAADDVDGPIRSQATVSFAGRWRARRLAAFQWSIDAVARPHHLPSCAFPVRSLLTLCFDAGHIVSKLFYGVAREADNLQHTPG